MNPEIKDLTLTEVIWKLHQDYPGRFAIFYGIIALIVLLVLVGLWQILGIGPRRRRGLRAARALLKAGSWQAALDQLKKTRSIGIPSSSWLKTFAQFEAECLQAAMKAALADKNFEDALQFGQ